jgi:RNA polymerase sigma-70 factor, ECF subfamily
VREDLNDDHRLAWEKDQHSRALAGDRAAFAALYAAYAPGIYRSVLMPKLGQAAAAEDALSETFRAAFEKLAQFEPRGSSIYFWLARIAENKALDLLRASAVTGRAIVNLQAHFVDLSPEPPGAEALLSGFQHEQRLRGRLSQCLAELNPRYRRVIELRFYAEQEREICAQQLQVSVSTFDVLLLRALRALRKQWEVQVANAKEPLSER